jgi:hypothetical protein
LHFVFSLSTCFEWRHLSCLVILHRQSTEDFSSSSSKIQRKMFRAQFLVLFMLYGRTKFTFNYFFLFAWTLPDVCFRKIIQKTMARKSF